MRIVQRILSLTASRETWWNNLTYAEQAAYRKAHPTSKWQINKFSPERLAAHQRIIKQTYAGYHKSTRGREYKDFIGRPVAIDDQEHHRRTNFYIWQRHIQLALTEGRKLPAKVLADYKRRTKLYDSKNSHKAYSLDVA